MNFDYTHGKEARYLVSVHWDMVSDGYYVSDLKTANKMFNDFVRNYSPNIVSIYNLKNDVRKALFRKEN